MRSIDPRPARVACGILLALAGASPASAADAPAAAAPQQAARRMAAQAQAPARASAVEPAAPAAGDGLEWVASHDVALARARKEKKLVLLDFYTDWCGWCKRLDKDVFSDAGFQKAAAGVLAVKVNAEKQPDLARHYQVNSYPRLFFLSPEGITLERIRGYLSLEDFKNKVAAVKRGDTEFARYRDAANDSRNITAVIAFARMLAESSQHDQAIPYWQQVNDTALEQIFQDPTQPGPQAFHRESLLELGNSYAAVGLPDVALQQYTEVLRSYPESMEAQRAIAGLAQMKTKDPSIRLPRALLEQIVRMQNGSPIAAQAQGLLDMGKTAPSGGAQ